ncbi:hypothetical protein BDV24DRAFT_128728 [Aspergillus arachidicola]|uniref:Uncharacterized protein n=2 Tax=Aspergillus subgen. Circumdati TaxID=2720871 RepID=A0A5N6YDV6_9EURO|nr:hypothetical protein BDV39DRAFT_167748 [Aspergillus sergii]KAE8343644.1 hypothetical protein BDV24DRAFT_128728 [Aspergillus arachidicola]
MRPPIPHYPAPTYCLPSTVLHTALLSLCFPSHVLEFLVGCALAPGTPVCTLYIPSPECNAHTKEYPPNCLISATCRPRAKATRTFAAGLCFPLDMVFAFVLLTLHNGWGT